MGWVPTALSRHTPNDLTFSHETPPPTGPPTSQWSAGWGPGFTWALQGHFQTAAPTNKKGEVGLGRLPVKLLVR